jgi:enterochelin esterase-like enzyme
MIFGGGQLVNKFFGSLILTLTTVLMVFSSHQSVMASSSRTETISYQTTYQGRQYQKKALVYLPAGYTKAKKYNTIYLLHGSTETARDFYRDGNWQSVLDREIAKGNLKRSIVVFPTYYPSRKFVTSNYYRDNRLNRAFAKNELVNDLVPAVEGHYSTYAKGTNQQALQNSREHRAFGGFSMGAITTWYVFQYQLPYFASYLPVAGDSWTVEDDGGSTASTATARRLANVVDQNSTESFHIFAGVGRNDGTSGSMTPQINAMWRQNAFNHTNLKYYQVPGGTHNPETVAKAFQHFAGEIFN